MRDGGGRTSSLRTGVRERAAHLAEQSAQWFSTKHPQLGAGVKRRCRLRYLHTRHSRFLSFRFEKKKLFRLCRVLLLLSCWPTASGDEIFHAAFSFRWLSLSDTSSSPHRVPHRPVSSRSPAPCEGGRFSLTHFPSSLRGHVSSIFHTCSTSSTSACWVNPSWLSIYTLM